MSNPIIQDVESVLFSAEQLDSITTRLAEEVRRDYLPADGSPRTRKMIVVCVLKGSVFFFVDFVRKLGFPVEIDFIKASSYYAGTTSSGQLKITLDLKRDDYENLDILLVEDIVDSGRTFKALSENLRGRGAHSVRTISLLDKPSRREVKFTADYIGAAIPDEFVIGYGLDYDERYRNLPYVGVLSPTVYNKN